MSSPVRRNPSPPPLRSLTMRRRLAARLPCKNIRVPPSFSPSSPSTSLLRTTFASPSFPPPSSASFADTTSIAAELTSPGLPKSSTPAPPPPPPPPPALTAAAPSLAGEACTRRDDNDDDADDDGGCCPVSVAAALGETSKCPSIMASCSGVPLIPGGNRCPYLFLGVAAAAGNQGHLLTSQLMPPQLVFYFIVQTTSKNHVITSLC